MTQQDQKKKGKAPDYKGDGVAVWQNTSASGVNYLSISLFGGQLKIAAFENKPKEDQPAPTTTPPVTQEHVQ